MIQTKLFDANAKTDNEGTMNEWLIAIQNEQKDFKLIDIKFSNSGTMVIYEIPMDGLNKNDLKYETELDEMWKKCVKSRPLHELEDILEPDPCISCNLTGQIPCPDCNGEGHIPPCCKDIDEMVKMSDTKSETCYVCEGKGFYLYHNNEKVCDICNGTGQLEKREFDCPHCNGNYHKCIHCNNGKIIELMDRPVQEILDDYTMIKMER